MISSSRHRDDNATIFDVCCEVQSNYELEPTNEKLIIKVLYPPEYLDDSILRSIKQFCFPVNQKLSTDNEAVQLFTFVLTDAQSLYTFGFCRYTPRNNSCICVLSGFLWVNFFYKLLNHISTVSNNGTPDDVQSLLVNAYHLDIQPPGSTLRINACTGLGRFSDQVPDPQQLPSLRDDKFLLEFFNAVNEKQMVQLYSALLKERRIIFTSTKLSQLSSCVFGISKLFYPFNWQNLFIPILPQNLKDMLMAPMPYLIGVPKQTFQKHNKAEYGDVVIMDLDEKILTSPYDDRLPSDALNFLQNRLKFPSDVFLSDSFARAFLQTSVLIFGNYTSGFVKNADAYVWDRYLFVERQRQTIRPYLHSLIGKEGVQYFERFIDERLMALNEDRVIVDEFEREVQLMGVRKNMDKNGGVMAPELIHQAVNSVKENANDVFGALKDQFHSISVRDKLSNFKPRRDKEPSKSKTTQRKRPNSSTAHSRSKCKHQIDPLSIDTSQFDFNLPSKLTIPTKTRSASPSDVEGAHSVGDLIDLTEDAPSISTMTNNIYSSPNLQQSETSTSNSPLFNSNRINSPSDLESYSPINHVPTSNVIKDRNKWQTFE